MVLLILALMFSVSWAFGFVMLHPGISYWYPVAYTTVVVIALAVPYIYGFISLRIWHVKPNRGLRHAH
jgi:hypothetical protein